MLRTIVGFLLLRFLPRRLLPVLTAWQVFQMIRNRRNRSAEPAADSRSRLRARRTPAD